MTLSYRFFSSRTARWILALALACTGAQAMAQEDPPGRVARLNAQQGTVSFSPAGDDSWYDAIPNRPLTTGDRLWSDRNARAELFVGSAALRLDSNTAIEFTEINDQAIRITVQQGTAQLRVRDDLSGQKVEVDTGNLAFVVQQPGDYRVQVDSQADLTQVMVASGAGTAYGESGEQTIVSARQQIVVNGRNLANAATAPMPLDDAFERWVAERSRAEDASISARYVSRETVGYQQLDNYGDWQNDNDYGPVWYPRNVASDWAPYSDGYWVSVAPWGWTWVDNAPWGFAPFHYGRWAQVGNRWGWVPGRQQSRPVYSPALVGFVGGGRGGSAQVPIGGGRNGIGWFPLAPGEAWRPGYHASQRYVEQANRMALYNRQPRNDFYANQRQQAVTVVPSDVFGRGPIGRRDHIRMPAAAFAGVPVANAPGIAPPSHFAPQIGSAPSGFMGRPATAIPPPQWQQRDRQQQQYGYRPPQEWRQPQDGRQPQDFQRQQPGQQPPRGLAGPSPQQLQQQQVQQQMQAQQQQQLQQYQQAVQQQQAVRQQQEAQQRAAQNQAVQMQQLQVQQQQQALRQQQEAQMRQAQLQQQQQIQQQQAMRQQQEMQQRAAQAQAQQQALAQQQAIAQQQALAQQQMQAMQQQQQAMQQRAQQIQQQQQQAAQQQRQQAQQQQQQQRTQQGLPGEIRDGSRQRRLPGQQGGDGP
ncbi:DUF6600 domain-containing protein [Variovorax robiniae]|uniref:DUF6600 domain-containing protein n=1 Tax=Variovorax robiniae TaxID=1836199 RepID=A0ABU8X6Q0_9BURK